MARIGLFSFGCLLVLATAQFQPPPDQQQQFGGQGNMDPRYQQQQQQQFSGQFGTQQQQQAGGQQGFVQGQGFGSGVNPNQPTVDAFGVPINPQSGQGQQQQQPNQFGGVGVQPQPGMGGSGGGSGQYVPQQGFGQGPPVKITTDLLPLDSAQHADKLLWTEPKSDVVYCVSTSPVTKLFWYCFDCNTTFGQQWNNYLSQSTADFQSITGYPSIRLNTVAINGELNMRTLGCIGQYAGPNGAPMNTTVATTIVLQYLSTPVIIDQQAHGPLIMNPNDGFHFYVPQSTRYVLHCLAQGNPPPTGYNWTVNGAPAPNAGSASQLIVDAQTYSGKALSCRVTSPAYLHGKESAPVGILTWIQPTLTTSNFQELQRQGGGLFDQGTSNVQLDKSATLQCGVTGMPVPWIWWRQEISPGNIINATCDGGRQDSTPTLGANGYAVASQCAIRIDSYEKAGRYWCSGCNYLSAGTYQCLPEERTVSQNSLRIDVIGRPVIRQDEQPRYERAEEMGTVKIGIPYCANPEPTLPDGVYWQINGQRLNLRNEVENYYAEATEQNTTVPNCWIARLRIRQVSEVDKAKTYRLTVTNPAGTTYREFQLNQLNATHTVNANGSQVGLAVGLPIAILIILLAICCGLCWWKKLLCFRTMDGRRQTPSHTKQQQSKQKDKYQTTSVVPDTIRTTPSGGLSEKALPPPTTRPTYDLPPSEPVHGNGSSSPNGRRKHEGLNYAELDLVKDSHHRPTMPPPSSVTSSIAAQQGRPLPPVDYSRFQPSSNTTSAGFTQLKSPTNSTV